MESKVSGHRTFCEDFILNLFSKEKRGTAPVMKIPLCGVVETYVRMLRA